MFSVFYLITLSSLTFSILSYSNHPSETEEPEPAALIRSVPRRASMLNRIFGSRNRPGVTPIAASLGGSIHPDEKHSKQRSFSFNGSSRRGSFGGPVTLPEPIVTHLLNPASVKATTQKNAADFGLLAVNEETFSCGAKSTPAMAGDSQKLSLHPYNRSVGRRFFSLVLRHTWRRPSIVNVGTDLWAQDQHILVLDALGIERFLKAENHLQSRYKAILVDGSFSHFSPDQWNHFETKFRSLNLKEVQEIVLQKQSPASPLFRLLAQRVKDLEILGCLGISESILDKENKKQLDEFLKKIPSLRELFFGKMQQDSGLFKTLEKLPSLKNRKKKKQCHVHYSSDPLNGKGFTHLRQILQGSL